MEKLCEKCGSVMRHFTICEHCYHDHAVKDIVEQKIEDIADKYGSRIVGGDTIYFKDDLRSLVQVVQMNRAENAKIIVPISLDDAEELKYGTEFDWTFPTDREGEYVDVHVKLEDEDDIE